MLKITGNGRSEWGGKKNHQLLLAAGADPALTNKSGKKPADYVTDESIASLLG